MGFSQWIIAHFFEIAGYLFALILIPRILLERHHPGATVAWLLAIGLIPYLGVPLYFLIGGKRIQKISREKDCGMMDKDCDHRSQQIAFLSPDIRKIAGLLMHTGYFQPSMDNKITIIDDGITTYTTLVGLLKNAEKSIEIATFILGRDDVGKALVSLLAQKARQGVKVRLLLDAYGCMRSHRRFVQPIRDAGGRVGVFLPMLPLRRRWSANLRNHRKLAIFDGCHALTGGMNLAKEYMGPTPFDKRWKDVCMVITGSGVEHLRAVFRQDWAFSTGETSVSSSTCPVNNPPLVRNGSLVQVVGDGPDITGRPLYSGVLAAINQAKESIRVVSPYFVPDEPLFAALELAAHMGCDVRIIVPEKSNHPLVDLASRSFLPDLMAAGVRFYYYQPGMLHAKLISIDRELAIVGSGNMDIRSFQLNFEIATFLYGTCDVRQVIEVIETLTRDSRQVTKEEVEIKNKFREFAEDICRVFSPLL